MISDAAFPQKPSKIYSCLKFCFICLSGGELLLSSACSYLPSSGPSASRIKSDAKAEKGVKSYQLVPITRDVVEVVAERAKVKRVGLSALDLSEQGGSKFTLPGVEKLPSASLPTIGVGDLVYVTFFETGGALFGSQSPTGGAAGTTSSQLPPQTVDFSGEITVPYAGRIPVKGRSFHAVEEEITQKLKGKAINPQVIVTVGERKGADLVTVTGDVKGPRELPLGFTGTKLLSAVTAAGGSNGKAHETEVSVIRGSLVRSDSLAEIIANPSKNVRLQAGDTVIVKSEPRTYLTFGAAGKSARLPFSTAKVTLAEAMAEVGGPLDSRSNPSAIYLYRVEPKSFVSRLGRNADEVPGNTTPVIYNLDLLSPQGFFLAQSFPVQDKDIIYFGNAGSVGLQKFLGLLSTVTSAVVSDATVATRVGGVPGQ